MASVTLSGVSKTYPGGHEAVRAMSLTIADGEFLVLVGPSGCGKSTTLRLIAGLEEATAGTIKIGEREVNRVHPKDRDVAMVFQNYALYPHMTVYKNMAFALRMRRVPRDEIDRRVRAVAGMLGIEGLLGRKPRALSGGQRQRVAVGRAIVREPKAFLFDEPLSNLDARLRLATRAELKALHQRLRTTTVYVTHDQEEAMTLGDRVVVMDGGVVQQAASPLEVYRRPANRFVAGFMGTPPMNFLKGKVVEGAEGVEFVEEGQDPARVALGGWARGHAGREVVLGFRPQALAFADSMSPAVGTRLGIRVGVVEPLGDVVDVTGTLESGAGVVARLAARELVRPGETLELVLPAEGAHLFEAGGEGARME